MSNLINNPLASFSLINLEFMRLNITDFDKNHVLSLLVCETLGLILSVFFYTLINIIT